MSVDLQQKLEELRSVHKLLRNAMAQEGDEDDALKQEHAEEMDNILNELSEKLKEAKTHDDPATKAEKSTAQDATPIDGHNSHSKVKIPHS